jgi:hypothetical protein
VTAGFLNRTAHSAPREHHVSTADRRTVRTVALIIAPMTLGLATLGGLGSFATVRQVAEPYFGRLAWIVPVGWMSASSSC